MKKKIILLVVLLLCLTLAGCGEKKNSNTENNLKGNIKETTKVSNIAESYGKYADLKSKAFDKLIDNIPEDDVTLSFSLLGFTMGDLMLVPISICGLSEADAAYSFAFMNIMDYKSDGDNCTVTYKNDDDVTKFETTYDKKTDSIQIKIYEEKVLSTIYEYIKLDEGYATLQYFYDNENLSSYRSIFNDNYISVGYFEDITTKPESIYKSKINSKDWTKGGKYWTEYDNGKFDSILNQE